MYQIHKYSYCHTSSSYGICAYSHSTSLLINAVLQTLPSSIMYPHRQAAIVGAINQTIKQWRIHLDALHIAFVLINKCYNINPKRRNRRRIKHGK